MRRWAVVMLAAVCMGVSPVMTAVAGPAGNDELVRAKVRVLAGVSERQPCVVKLSLDAARLGALPEAMTGVAIDQATGEATPCSVAVRAGEAASHRPASVDVSFMLQKPLGVMASRDFGIVLRAADKTSVPVEGPLPGAVATMVPLETRLLTLEMAGKGKVHSLDEAAPGAAAPFNGGFDIDSYQVESAATGWSGKAFRGAGDARIERGVETIDGRENRFGRIGQSSGYVGFVSAPFPVQGGRYKVSLRSRGDGAARPVAATAVNVVLRLVGAEGDAISNRRWEINWPDLPLTASWTAHERTMPVPRGPCWGYLIVRADAEAHFDVDDVHIEAVSTLPPLVQFERESQYLPIRTIPEEASSQDLVWNAQSQGLTLRPCKNLVADGGFEADGAWVFSDPKWMERSGEMKWTGEKALRLKYPGGAQRPPVVTAAQQIELDPGKPYVLSLVYSSKAGGATTRVRVETATRAILVDDVLPAQFARPGDGWIRRRLLIPAGLSGSHEPIVRATLSFLYETTGSNPTFIDDVCLTEGGAAAPFSLDASYTGEGTVISSMVDLGPAAAPTIEWAAATPPGTSLEMFTRCGPTPYYDAGSWDHWRPATSGGPVPTLGRGMDCHVQWKAVFHTERADATPLLQRVTLRRSDGAAPAASPAIRLTALDNGQITAASTQWLALVAKEQPLDVWMKTPEFVAMSEAARHVIAPYADDFDQQQALLNYFTNNITVCYGGKKVEEQPKQFSAAVYGRWFENSSRGLGNVICAHYGVMHAALLRGVGIPARMISPGGFAGAGHDMSEVWSDKHQKWYFSDSQYGGILVRDGIPLSLQDVQELYLRGAYHEVRTQTSALSRGALWRFESGWGAMSPTQYVGRENKDCKADILLSHLLEWTEERMDLAQWYAPADYLFMRDPYYRDPGDGKNTFTSGIFSDPQRLRFKLNQVQMQFDVIDEASVAVRLQQNALDFDHYELTLNGKAQDVREDRITWPLAAGANHIEARTVSKQGHRGKLFSADLWREAGK